MSHKEEGQFKTELSKRGPADFAGEVGQNNTWSAIAWTHYRSQEWALEPETPKKLKFPCPSFPWFFLVLIKENLRITKDLLSLPNPPNPWKRQRKPQNNQGNSLLKIDQGNPKNQGKEGQGLWLRFNSFSTPGAFFNILGVSGPKGPNNSCKVRSEKLQNESFPNFAKFHPESCPGSSPNFWRSFRASFRGRRRPGKIHPKKSPAFFYCKIPRQVRRKNPQKLSGERGQSSERGQGAKQHRMRLGHCWLQDFSGTRFSPP